MIAIIDRISIFQKLKMGNVDIELFPKLFCFVWNIYVHLRILQGIQLSVIFSGKFVFKKIKTKTHTHDDRLCEIMSYLPNERMRAHNIGFQSLTESKQIATINMFLKTIQTRQCCLSWIHALGKLCGNYATIFFSHILISEFAQNHRPTIAQYTTIPRNQTKALYDLRFILISCFTIDCLKLALFCIDCVYGSFELIFYAMILKTLAVIILCRTFGGI